jgi:N-acetylglucosaminyldiphosphoundecaprenol N-acetyl-beta-D-mannosaminyltransferase
MAATPQRIRIGKVPIDVVCLSDIPRIVDAIIERGEGGTVFTPNVDHIVLSESVERFRTAYDSASLSVVDGVPVLWASKLLGTPLPMKISGSDLVFPLLRHARDRGYRVYFLGADPGIAQLAKAKVEADLPGVQIVGVDSPRINIDGDNSSVLERIQRSRADIVLVALGAPKQEIFCHEHRRALAPAVLFGIGASLDFLAGAKRRAPAWVSNAGLEWLFRLVQEPRRLAHRYLMRDPQFLGIVYQQWRQWRTNAP